MFLTYGSTTHIQVDHRANAVHTGRGQDGQTSAQSFTGLQSAAYRWLYRYVGGEDR